MRESTQLRLRLTHKGRGGFRPGAGRKPKPASAKGPVAHRVRIRFASRHPVLVTLRVCPHVYHLRSRRCFSVIRRAFELACDRLGCRITDFSVQGNHIHLIVEARDATCLARGIKGFCVRVARGLNAVMGRKGTVFAERYHVRVLRTPREVHHARCYVVNNARRHGAQRGRSYESGWTDPYSSAAWFDGWRKQARPVAPSTGPPLVAAPKTWLMRKGWRRHGLLDPAHVPGR